MKELKAAAPTPRPKAKPRIAGLPRPRKAIPPLPTFTSSPSSSPDQIPKTLSQLHYYATLFQQLHVRHKNQHRAQLWFKQLSLLRRAVRDLLEVDIKLLELQQGHQANQISAEDVRKKFDGERQLVSSKASLTVWIREVLVPECYVTSSVMVADGDGGFANLGAVLVAAVAGLAALVGLPKEVEEEGMEGVERDVDARAERVKHQKQTNVRRETLGANNQGEPQADMNLGEDFGTVIDRAKVSEGLQARGDEQTSTKAKEQDVEGLIEAEEKGATDQVKIRSNEFGALSKKTEGKREPDTSMEAASRDESPSPATTILSKNAKKKAKRKKNAIDDLFEGFA